MVDGRRVCGGLNGERSTLNSQCPSCRGVWKDAPIKWTAAGAVPSRARTELHSPPVGRWALCQQRLVSVPVRMREVPGPGALDDRLDLLKLWFPAEFASRAFASGD